MPCWQGIQQCAAYNDGTHNATGSQVMDQKQTCRPYSGSSVIAQCNRHTQADDYRSCQPCLNVKYAGHQLNSHNFFHRGTFAVISKKFTRSSGGSHPGALLAFAAECDLQGCAGTHWHGAQNDVTTSACHMLLCAHSGLCSARIAACVVLHISRQATTEMVCQRQQRELISCQV